MILILTIMTCDFVTTNKEKKLQHSYCISLCFMLFIPSPFSRLIKSAVMTYREVYALIGMRCKRNGRRLLGIPAILTIIIYASILLNECVVCCFKGREDITLFIKYKPYLYIVCLFLALFKAPSSSLLTMMRSPQLLASFMYFHSLHYFPLSHRRMPSSKKYGYVYIRKRSLVTLLGTLT